jgi:MFS family permease
MTPAAQRRNVLCLGADMTLFMMALGLISPLTLVPLFVSKLTDSPLAIGMLMAVFQLGWLPQLFTAGLYERTPDKRRWLMVSTVLERVPTLVLALLAMLATSLATPLVLGLIYLARFAHMAIGGTAATAWLDYVARAIPAERRGSFLGNWTMIGNLLGAGAALLAAPLLERLPFPYGFAACFGLGALILFVGVLPLLGLVDPPGPPPRPVRPFRAQLAELPALLRGDAPFRRFLVAMALTTLGTMGVSFVAVYGVAGLGATDELAGWYTSAMLLGQVGANLLLGRLADRRGFGTAALLSALSNAGLAGLALVVADPLWLLPAFVLLGAGQAGMMLARMAGPMEFGPEDRLPSYLAVSNALLSLVAAATPLLGAQVVALLGYQWLFVISLALSLAAAPLLRVEGPKSKVQNSGRGTPLTVPEVGT